MRIGRHSGVAPTIPLVPMVDVLMILLIFFMVTSSFLDLDMVPLNAAPDPAGAAPRGDAAADAADADAAAAPERLLIRLGSDGQAHVRGRALADADLAALLAGRLAAAPGLDVIVLPSGGASVQALARLMDVAVAAGVHRLRIVRLEPAP